MKTAGRILGSAFFAEGFEVQDAPRYGAERRGAPLFATVRASRLPIRERGPVRVPDVVVCADDSLLTVAVAGVLEGIGPTTVMLLASDSGPGVWRERLRLRGPTFVLPSVPQGEGQSAGSGLVGAAAAAAVARLSGVVTWRAVESALRQELAALDDFVLAEDLRLASEAWERFAPYAGSVHEGDEVEVAPGSRPDWVEVPLDPASMAAPDIHGGVTSVEVRTGLWRTMRPVIDLERCNHCSWICSTLCPDGAIEVDSDGAPRIDYDHCKGCLVCVAVCPPHAIGAVPERGATMPEEKSP
jgi:pyruvate ferredoxin oxidoreductase gamma subunit